MGLEPTTSAVTGRHTKPIILHGHIAVITLRLVFILNYSSIFLNRIWNSSGEGTQNIYSFSFIRGFRGMVKNPLIYYKKMA